MHRSDEANPLRPLAHVPLPRLGVIGGGQLAKMTAAAAASFGCEVIVFERQDEFPAHSVDTHALVGDWNRPDELLRLAPLVDVVTLENEFVCTDALSVLCDAAVAQGVVLCVAAGNAGPGASTVGSPGCAKTVITVGATTKSDQVASFSSRGPTSDGRIKPDVCFPGANIVACRASGTSMGTPINAWYTSASGTSMATPHATGACALLLQAKPGLSPQQIKDTLMNTAKDLGLDANTQGKGRAQVFAAYQSALGQEPQPQPPAPPTPPGTGCLATLQRWLGMG